MKHLSIDITDEQRNNFIKLADYLEAGELKKLFSMKLYCHDGKADIQPKNHNCGTVGCALGNGPDAGVEPLDGERWWAYSQRCFVLDTSPLWDWCFGSEWCVVDNTSAGAAARIRYALEHGVPCNFDKQYLGNAPLCYKAEVA